MYQDHKRDQNVVVPQKPAEKAIGITRVIEPYYVDLFSDLNVEYPVDLVPVLTIARERLLDRHATADKERKAIYELGAKLLEGMKDVAEQRTQLLEALLKSAARPNSTLETTQPMNSSGQHFLAGQARRSNEALKRRRQPLDSLFIQLRTAEREWNARLPENARQETYNFKGLPYAVITVQAEARQNPLEQRAYDQKRAVYPWRSSYYDQYGYPRSY